MKLAIVNGKVLTMSDKGPKVLEGGTVLVCNGIIEKLMKKGKVIPDGYRK